MSEFVEGDKDARSAPPVVVLAVEQLIEKAARVWIVVCEAEESACDGFIEESVLVEGELRVEAVEDDHVVEWGRKAAGVVFPLLLEQGTVLGVKDRNGKKDACREGKVQGEEGD